MAPDSVAINAATSPPLQNLWTLDELYRLDDIAPWLDLAHGPDLGYPGLKH